jgi:hypothetical protein
MGFDKELESRASEVKSSVSASAIAKQKMALRGARLRESVARDLGDLNMGEVGWG